MGASISAFPTPDESPLSRMRGRLGWGPPEHDARGIMPASKPADQKENGRAESPAVQFLRVCSSQAAAACERSNCSSSVEPVNAVTLDAPPWITVVTSSK